MATRSDTAPSQPEDRSDPVNDGDPAAQWVEYEQFIEAQLRKTRSHVRGVDIAGSLMTLAAGTLAYFFLAGMLDHWVISGGLGFWGRLLSLAVYVAVAAYYVGTQLLPLFLRRINPVYAAQAIERSRPSLKNALVNFLFFRADPRGLPPAVFQAIEEQAATNLAKARVEAAVDRTKLIRIGYALLGILFVCALYTLLSPKDLLKTVGRVVMPWAEIGTPTRTAIIEIEPGDTQAFRGQQVTVSARVQGVANDAKVTLLYSTVDGQIADRPVEMVLPVDGYRHSCVLPASDTVLQQSIDYRIVAGDATTKRFHIEVVAAPTIVVHGVEYKYPSYTGLVAQRVERQGDLKALEGTEVTLDALANQDILSGNIDFDCDGKLDQRMQIDKQRAKVSFRLTLKEDRQTPTHTCYQLLFKNDQGQQNPQAVRHQIEVTRDVPPEIQFVSPKDEIDLPSNGVVDLEVVANDPDFALQMVKLSVTSLKQPVLDQMLLNEAWRGQFVKKFRFEPRKLGLKAGDVVEYSAIAQDNKDPQPNRTETATRRIRIVSPSQHQPPQDQVAKNDQENPGQQPGGEGQRGGDDEHPRDKDGKPDRKPEQPKAGANKPNDAQDQREDQQPADAQGQPKPDQDAGEQGGQSGSKSAQQGGGQQSDTAGQKPGAGEQDKQPVADQNVPSDGSDDGDAIERILKHRDEQNKSQPKPGDQQQQQQQHSKDEQKPADQQSGNPSSANEPGGDAEQKQSPAGDQQGKGRQGKGQPNRKPEPGNDEAGQKPADKSAAGDKKPADQQQGDESATDQQPNRQNGGDKSKPSDERKSQKPDASKGQKGLKGQQGAGGEPGAGDESDSGQQGQAGQKGQPGKKPNLGKGQSGEPGDGGDDAGDSSAQQSPQGKSNKGGKPTPAKPGDSQTPPSKAQDDADENGQGAGGKESKADKGADRNQKPQTADQSGGKSGQPQSKSQGKDPQQAEPGDQNEGKGEPVGETKRSDEMKSGKKPGKAKQNQAPEDHRAGEARDSGTPDKGDPEGEAKQGKGAQSKGEAKPDRDQKPAQNKSNPDAKGGDGENEKGESGAGQAGQETKGAPTPMDTSQPRDKANQNTPDEKDSKPDDGAQSPSINQRESNSEGIDDGDRSGGGKRGGGQKANKSGTGGAGQNTAADEGAGRSDEAGKGETSGRAGGDKATDKPTGQSGSQPGKGSSTRPASQPGGKPGGGPAPEGSSPPTQPNNPSGDNQQQGQADGQSSGSSQGGKPPDGPVKEQTWRATPDSADEANLDYARKATDLALEHLKDQLRKEKPDPELLDRLGWKRKDLENFVRRWEQMRKQSQLQGEKGASAREELDETLRSLGLRPRATSLSGNRARDDQSHGMKESRRTSPPPEYLEQSKAYSQGTSRGGK